VAAVDAVDRVTVIAADQDGPESGVDVGPAVVVGAAGTEADGRRAARHRDEARLDLQRELVAHRIESTRGAYGTHDDANPCQTSTNTEYRCFSVVPCQVVN
jgi:hypothetical protein